MIAEVTDRTFEAMVERAAVPVLVEFWQPGCGHCQALRQELEYVDATLEGRVLIVGMNVQEQRQIAAEVEIESLPALALYRHGTFQQFIGGIGKKDEILRQLLKSGALD